MPISETVIPLYDGPAPGSESWTHTEQEQFNEAWQTQIVYNVTAPTLTVFRPKPAQANGTALVICPGGGFHALSIESEGFEVARRLNAVGVTCFVLKYRLVPCKTDNPPQEMEEKGEAFIRDATPIIKMSMADGLAAMSYVRVHAADYGLRPERIGIMGFSAGGTVAASVMYNYPMESQPNFAAPIYLAYEWVPREGVPVDAPPIFILAASDDEVGLAPHSVALYNDWIAAEKSAELHLYAKGGHGFGMRQQNLPSDGWLELFIDWLRGQKLLPR